ncbi:MAG: hypothetical protein ACRCWJ_09465 [Casimicrobium sp.]
MRFTIVFRGRIPASGDVKQIEAIRENSYVQSQLAALYAVTSKHFSTNNKQIIGGALYTAIVPISWVCQIEIVLLRATPPSRISGVPDLDNTLKTLFDAVCAPAGVSHAVGTPVTQSLYVLALEDKQFSSVAVSGDQHWTSSPNDDLAIMRVTTQETPIDDAVALGGQSFTSLRKHVH